MKLIIEIPNEMYECVQNGTYCGTLYEELKNGTPLSESEDCVSRQAAIDAIEKLCEECNADYCGECRVKFDGVKNCKTILEQLPPVKPAEKVGQWEWEQESFTKNWGNWHCSKCREIITVCETDWAKINKPIYKYCPNCGTKMQEVEE